MLHDDVYEGDEARSCKQQLVRRRLAPVEELMRYLIPVVRLNIRGRSHCTWLRCPMHPRHGGGAGRKPLMCEPVVNSPTLIFFRAMDLLKKPPRENQLDSFLNFLRT